ncbi:hypothetical protein ACFL1X_11555 [Candidatus Hydrogenedentota bacterium]
MANPRLISPKTAAELVFCLEQLRLLERTKPEHVKLWQLRVKVVRFIVSQHDLRDLAGSYHLSDEEKTEIRRTESLLHLHVRHEQSFETEEVRRVREKLRDKLRNLTTWHSSS